VITVVLFGDVFGSAIAVPGGGNHREYLIPSLFVMTSVTGVMATLTGVAADISRGDGPVPVNADGRAGGAVRATRGLAWEYKWY
jgi:hypothetical protein